ncbi:2-keto-3-deoxygluconate permease [Staphylococcus ureilyticus]|uniref:2-keto-3-deoxygluconate permease n=1 Tax=Staphylococcus TaxID=1279 RepID=UPI0008A62206|nr:MULTISPECIES: 2-keto-3-deoxygluconate permease [Staphylococcus]PIS61868.1 2-keto-3-deoxygluconate permease [Corynebacterium striatum]PTF46109.1 2-keto-3-deoxygluconate permease [Staphylococcus cohnii]MBM9448086.1 2-keto-3-deoxygluconate permease [Staphylococcus ureilyticus]MDK7753643.1 2-keto-3-deoxygluconate permease [Staphylococcus sp. UMB10092B]MDT3982210.1 2-keto-3-deoxygluconate permease [Staphylococcus ureilyticus]
MRIKDTIEKIPGGLMVVPLLLGATINTVDQLHLTPIMNLLKSLGAPKTEQGYYEMLQIGGFSQELFKDSALVLIALFIFCVGSQMNLKIGGKALKKGMLLTTTKYFSGLAVGLLLGSLFDPWSGLFGLSTIAVIAAMTNSNSGMYAALTSTYGNRSDVGGLSILAINDGPLLTLISLGFIGTSFPIISFISVLLPLSIGMILGNLDPKISEFLRPGETILIPFFAFSLGAGMNLAEFFNFSVLSGGLTLAVLTFICTAFTGIIAFKIFKEKSVIAPISESSTAGNAVSTPAAVVAAASTALANGNLSQSEYAMIEKVAPIATAQISISAITTAILCPIAVILIDRYQKSKGIYGTKEYVTQSTQTHSNAEIKSHFYESASYKEEDRP